MQIAMRYAAVVVLAWIMAIALWPWLQIGNPWQQFKVALVHFATIPMSYEFSYWGERIWTDGLPCSYIPAQLLGPVAGSVSLPPGCCASSTQFPPWWSSRGKRRRHGAYDRSAGLRTAALTVVRARACLIVCAAVIFPLAFLIVQHATIYNGIRHVLFVIPMLAVIAGGGLRALLPLLHRVPIVAAIVGGAYAGSIVTTLAVLHPLEYVAMNAFAGGTRGAYDRFELDYFVGGGDRSLASAGASLDYDTSIRSAETPPSILICIPWREERVDPMLKRPWMVETDPDKADFIIATELSRCAENKRLELIDEVKRFDRTFAWVYARRPS